MRVLTAPLAYVLLDFRWFDVANAMRGQKVYEQPDSGKHPAARWKHTLNLEQGRQESGQDEFEGSLLNIGQTHRQGQLRKPNTSCGSLPDEKQIADDQDRIVANLQFAALRTYNAPHVRALRRERTDAGQSRHLVWRGRSSTTIQ